MKASDFIVHLQKMINEHGDLPLVLMEHSGDSYGRNFVEIGKVEDVVDLGMYDNVFNENDCRNLLARKIFLID